MDAGLQTITYIYYKMHIDKEWSVLEGRGFSWWGGFLKQKIWADAPFESDGYTVCRIHIRTDLLQNYRSTYEQNVFLQARTGFGTTSGIVRSEQDETLIQMATSLYVHTGTLEWMQELAAWLAPLQCAEAHIVAMQIEGQLEDDIAISGHPQSGIRHGLDEILGIIDIIVEEGKQPSHWRKPHNMERIRNIGKRQYSDESVVSDVSSIIPFLGDTAMLYTATDSPNPMVGNGILSVLTLPVSANQNELEFKVRLALEMNELEVYSPTYMPFIGSWCSGPHGLAYTTFLANSLYALGSFKEFYLPAWEYRSRWAANVWEKEATRLLRPVSSGKARDAPLGLPRNPKDGAELVYIPAGKFLMGDDDYSDNPRHTVELTDYYIYKNVVTVEQYEAYCKATGTDMPDAPDFNEDWEKKDHPIVNVTWDEARAYAKWSGGDLPSEAQWERAACGTDGRKYPWGDTFDSSKCWCSKKDWFDSGGTAPVGNYGISPEGCTDMAGNVCQWCLDGYDAKYWEDSSSKVLNPVNSTVTKYRVLRGASWGIIDPDLFRCAFRFDSDPSYWFNYGYFIGFRCVFRVNS